MALKLAIVTPDADVLTVECDEVVVPGSNGEIGFLPGHVAMITGLRPGVLTWIRGGKKSYLAVGAGFAEVESDVVSVMTELAEEGSAIDVQGARRSLGEAEEKMKIISPEDPTYLEVRRTLEQSTARLDATQRRA